MDTERNKPTLADPTIAPQPLKPKKNKLFFVLSGAAILLVFILGLVLGVAYFKNKNHPSSQTNIADNNFVDQTNNLDQTVPTDKQPLVSGLITWNYPAQVFSQQLVKGNENNPDPEKDTKYFDVGFFNSGKYQGGKLLIVETPCDGPCSGYVYRIVEFSSQYYLLTKYSDEVSDTSFLDQTKITKDAETTISDLEQPQKINGPKTGQVLVKADYPFFTVSYIQFNSTGLKFAFNDPLVGAVYTTPDNPDTVEDDYKLFGYYVKMPDFGLAIYKVQIDFVGADNIPKVTWNDGSPNSGEYVYTDRTGCGGSNYASVQTGKVLMSDLAAAGKTSAGQMIYEYKDPQNQVLKDLYNNEYQVYGENAQKVSYDEYIKAHPIFFYTDTFGRLIRFESTKFILQAECGKPVIYLYPTKPTDVSVSLNPVGGFSYTDPAYNSGWQVFAQPDGTLTNLFDGKNYPYLFWEGRGGLYQTPDKGFVVAQKDVHKFLIEKLAQLGLNQKESTDFMEFWEPRMQSANYYFVTFMGNSVMDKIASLNITPKPDTVIRILMDFMPLEKPIAAQGYEIKTPVRNGFTAVEWGGVIR